MESAYWFLFSLFWIDVQFGIADLISNKFLKKYELIAVPILCFLSTSVLLYIGSLVGISLLGIKYTTYYMPFFIMGWVIKELKMHIYSRIQWGRFPIYDLSYIIMLIVFSVSLAKFSIVEMPDTGMSIIIRFAISTCGCLSVLYFCENWHPSYNWVKRLIYLFGSKSLELYIIQLILIGLLADTGNVFINTTSGIINMCLYLILITALCFITIKALSITPLCRLVFFGKMNDKT